MESQIADKDQLISRLEKQRNRLEKEKEEEGQNATKCKDESEAKSASFDKVVEEKEVICFDRSFSNKRKVLHSQLVEVSKIQEANVG